MHYSWTCPSTSSFNSLYLTSSTWTFYFKPYWTIDASDQASPAQKQGSRSWKFSGEVRREIRRGVWGKGMQVCLWWEGSFKRDEEERKKQDRYFAFQEWKRLESLDPLIFFLFFLTYHATHLENSMKERYGSHLHKQPPSTDPQPIFFLH